MKINKNIILLTLFLLFLAALPGGLVAVCGGALRRFFGAWFGSLRCAGGEEEKEPPSQPPITKNIKKDSTGTRETSRGILPLTNYAAP